MPLLIFRLSATKFTVPYRYAASEGSRSLSQLENHRNRRAHELFRISKSCLLSDNAFVENVDNAVSPRSLRPNPDAI